MLARLFNLIEGSLYRSPLRLRLTEAEDPIKQARNLGYSRGRRGNQAPPPPGVDLAAYQAGFKSGTNFSGHHQAGLTHEGQAPSGPHSNYYDKEALNQHTTSPYYTGSDRSQATASSREVRANTPDVENGSWRISNRNRLYGHDVEQLGAFNPKDLHPDEFDWENPEARLRDEGRLKDAHRYVDWIKAGHEPPPISVVQNDRGELRVTEGHRRLYASHLAGKPVKAWTSWAADHPDGRTDWEGKPIKVGLSHRIVTKSGLPDGVKHDGDYTNKSLPGGSQSSSSTREASKQADPFERIWAEVRAREQAADKMSSGLGDAQAAQLKIANPRSAHHLMIHRSSRGDAPSDRPFQVTRFDSQMEPLGHSYVKDMRAGIHHAWKEHGEVELA